MRYSYETILQIKEDHKNGVSYNSLCKKYHLGKDTLRKYLNIELLAIIKSYKHYKLSESIIDDIIKRFESLESIKDIAIHYKVNHRTVWNLLRFLGYDTSISSRRKTTCLGCGKEINDDYYGKKFNRRCKGCESKRKRMANKKLKGEIFSHYGSECECCGEAILEFLSIDHIINNGKEDRKSKGSGMQFYRWLKRNNYPRDHYRLLCMNCNWGRGHFIDNRNKCPHELTRESIV